MARKTTVWVCTECAEKNHGLLPVAHGALKYEKCSECKGDRPCMTIIRYAPRKVRSRRSAPTSRKIVTAVRTNPRRGATKRIESVLSEEKFLLARMSDADVIHLSSRIAGAVFEKKR